MTDISHREHSLIVQAQRSRSDKELKTLSRHQFSNVRRCVAKNTNTPRHVLDLLAQDPVKNVSYAALKNVRCTVKRDMSYFDERCVICPVNESDYINKCRTCR